MKPLQFIKQNKYKYIPLSKDVIGSCIKFEESWCEDKKCDQIEGLSKERSAIYRLLNNFESLSAIGAAIEINGNIKAFTLGEALNRNTFVIHVEKADNDTIGLYQAINWEFLRNHAKDFKFVNREQDLGVQGIRKAKMSYGPVRLVKKYKIKNKLNLDN